MTEDYDYETPDYCRVCDAMLDGPLTHVWHLVDGEYVEYGPMHHGCADTLCASEAEYLRDEPDDEAAQC